MDAPSFRTLIPEDASGDPLDLYIEAPRPAHDGRPWLLSNFVAGVDGSIAIDGRVRELNTPADKVVFRLLRSLADVILVGAQTVRAEGYGPARPRPETRKARERRGQHPVPRFAVVTGSMHLDWASPFFTEAEVQPIVLTVDGDEPDHLRRHEQARDVAEVVVAGRERVDPLLALKALRDRGADIVVNEGGPALHRQLLAAGCLDELCLTLAPMLGGDPMRIVSDEPRLGLTHLELAHVLAGPEGELFLRYLLPPARTDP